MKEVRAEEESKEAAKTLWSMIIGLGVLMIPAAIYTTKIYIQEKIYLDAIKAFKHDISKIGNLIQYVRNLF